MNNVPDLNRFLQRRSKDTRRLSVSESLNNARSTILFNMIIDIASALVLLVGLFFAIRFLFGWKKHMDVVYFNLFFGATVLFTAGWIFLTIIKLRSYIERLKKPRGR
jgi:hypothetical protein